MKKSIFVWIFSLLAFGRCEVPYDVCEGVTIGFLPHPDPRNCVEFILCVLEEPTVFPCERANEIFYPPVGNCVPGEEGHF
jgi:hypothetical protein